MSLLTEVNPPETVAPATVMPGLAEKVKVHEILLAARGGTCQINGLRVAVSEHFLTKTKI